MLVTSPYTGHFDEECHVFKSDFQRFMWFLMYNHLGCLTRLNDGGLLEGPLGFGQMPDFARFCSEELMAKIMFVKQNSLKRIRDAHTDKLVHELRELPSSDSSDTSDSSDSSDSSDDDESINASWTTVVEAADFRRHQQVIQLDDDEDDDDVSYYICMTITFKRHIASPIQQSGLRILSSQPKEKCNNSTML